MVMRYQLSVSVLLLVALSPMTMQAQQLAVSHTPSAAMTQQPPKVMLQPTGKPVARVNGAVLTDRDLQREMYTLFPYARQHNGQVPPELEPQIRQGALQMIVFEEL